MLAWVRLERLSGFDLIEKVTLKNRAFWHSWGIKFFQFLLFLAEMLAFDRISAHLRMLKFRNSSHWGSHSYLQPLNLPNLIVSKHEKKSLDR